jgi:hypothetical protein
MYKLKIMSDNNDIEITQNKNNILKNNKKEQEIEDEKRLINLEVIKAEQESLMSFQKMKYIKFKILKLLIELSLFTETKMIILM